MVSLSRSLSLSLLRARSLSYRGGGPKLNRIQSSTTDRCKSSRMPPGRHWCTLQTKGVSFRSLLVSFDTNVCLLEDISAHLQAQKVSKEPRETQKRPTLEVKKVTHGDDLQFGPHRTLVLAGGRERE